MKVQVILLGFILKEWLMLSSGVGLILISVYTRHFPVYSIQELQVLFILLVLFITVKGLQTSGVILKIAQTIEKGRGICVKLVVTTFLLSMLVTNDIALIIMVPLTLSLDINRKDILVILEALAANSGSAFTPLGNPQNLFIYWYYNIRPLEFIQTIAPFSLLFFVILFVASLLLKIKNGSRINKEQRVDKKAYIYAALLLIIILSVLHIIPVLTGMIVIVFALLVDRKSLRIDYALLLSFLFFFGISNNLKLLLSNEINYSRHIFLFSALASQVMSNVPTTLLFAKFTSNWQALLWGTNAGGFGSLFGSLANLIAYKIYVTSDNSGNIASFTIRFLLMGYGALFIAVGWFFLLDLSY